jgi:hypothetical protein
MSVVLEAPPPWNGLSLHITIRVFYEYRQWIPFLPPYVPIVFSVDANGVHSVSDTVPDIDDTAFLLIQSCPEAQLYVPPISPQLRRPSLSRVRCTLKRTPV